MNKRSSRLAAWLMTLLMIINIIPTSAFASVVDDYTGPETRVLETLSAGTPPNEDNKTFDVQYVIEGKYTYNGQNLVLTQYGKTDQKGNPSTYAPATIPECNGNMSRTWEEGMLTFHVQPNEGVSIHIRYLAIYTAANITT